VVEDAMAMGNVYLFVRLIVTLLCIYASWWALQELRFEKLVRTPGSPQAKLLHLILAVILGHHFASFLFSYFGWPISIG